LSWRGHFALETVEEVALAMEEFLARTAG